MIRADAKRDVRSRDRGGILPLVLVVTVVLGALVVATATYATTTLRYGRVVEGRADRLAAAEAGMRDVINRIDNNQFPLCATNAGSGSGTTVQLPDFNDSAVAVNCQHVDGTLSSTTSWAMAITGEGGAGYGIHTQEAHEKVFGGPTYIARLDLLDLGPDLQIKDGDLWFTDPGCDAGGEQYGGSYPGALTFSSPVHGVWCTNEPWSDLFIEPDVPALPTGSQNANGTAIGGCTVFEPGRYTSPLNIGSNTYLKSGDYLFDFNGIVEIDGGGSSGAIVTVGREGVGGDAQTMDNTVCDSIRNADAATGATLYLTQGARINVKKGSIEILRRQHGDDFVSIHALSSSTLGYVDPIISTKSGDNAGMAIHGSIWAPRAKIEFGNVTNTVIAQLTGGAVVASVDVSASASATGLVISVGGGPVSDRWQLISSATSDDGTVTRVSAIAQVRNSYTPQGQAVWEIAVNSWRVCGATC